MGCGNMEENQIWALISTVGLGAALLPASESLDKEVSADPFGSDAKASWEVPLRGVVLLRRALAARINDWD
jgi:hypothetical protein